MVKYNLETEEYLHETLPNGLFGNQGAYQPSAFTDFDFAIDEEGLWVGGLDFKLYYCRVFLCFRIKLNPFKRLFIRRWKIRLIW